MAIKRNRRFHAEVATSALSDIMFFLLLFFLIISTLANPNVIKVPLPQAKNNEKTNKAHVALSVEIDPVTNAKKYSLDDKQSGGKYTKFNEKLLYSTIIHRCIRLSFVGNKILFNDEPERKYSEDALDNLEYIKYISILPFYISLKER